MIPSTSKSLFLGGVSNLAYTTKQNTAKRPYGAEHYYTERLDATERVFTVRRYTATLRDYTIRYDTKRSDWTRQYNTLQCDFTKKGGLHSLKNKSGGYTAEEWDAMILETIQHWVETFPKILLKNPRGISWHQLQDRYEDEFHALHVYGCCLDGIDILKKRGIVREFKKPEFEITCMWGLLEFRFEMESFYKLTKKGRNLLENPKKGEAADK